MKTRTIIPLVIGLAIGVFAIRYFVKVVKQARGASADTVEVVCASADISPTVEIKGTMLEVKSIPKVAAPKLYIADKREVEGRVAAQFIPAGQPIVQGLMAPKGTLPGLAVRIPPGMRAVSVQVDESAGVAGWVKPGSRVDVVAVMTGHSGGGGNDTISKVILQNVEVLAVGQDSGSAKTDGATSLAKTVTVAVAPGEMARLHLATSKGKIRFAMRNQTDEQTDSRTASATDNDLVGNKPKNENKSLGGFLGGFLSKLPKPEAQPTDKEASAPQPEPAGHAEKPTAPAQKVSNVEVIQGSMISVVTFKGEGKNQTRVSPGKGTSAQEQPAQDEQAQPQPEPAPGSEG